MFRPRYRIQQGVARLQGGLKNSEDNRSLTVGVRDAAVNASYPTLSRDRKEAVGLFQHSFQAAVLRFVAMLKFPRASRRFSTPQTQSVRATDVLKKL
jgi:hypothetical protein